MKNNSVVTYFEGKASIEGQSKLVHAANVFYDAEGMVIFRLETGPKRPTVVHQSGGTNGEFITLAPDRDSREYESIQFKGLPLKEPFIYGWIPGRYCIDVLVADYEIERSFVANS